MRVKKPLNEVKICVKGITFRSGVKELYHSRNLTLAKLLVEKGLDVYVYDELFTEGEILDMGLRCIEPSGLDAGLHPPPGSFEASLHLRRTCNKARGACSALPCERGAGAGDEAYCPRSN